MIKTRSNSLINEDIEFEDSLATAMSYSLQDMIDSNSIVDERNLSSALLFGCEKCAGPLIPISECLVCKRTIFRRCIKCDFVKKTGNHKNCFAALSYFLYYKKSKSKVET